MSYDIFAEYKYRKDYEQGDHRHHEAAHGADGEGIPKGFAGLAYDERDEAEDGGEDCQHDRDNLDTE